MTSTETQSAISCREYQPSDFSGVQALWRNEAGWGELSPDMFRQWYVNIPDGPAILVVAEDDQGEITGLITMTPHRIALPGRVIQGARIAANIVSSKRPATLFDFANHPLPRMLLECRAAAARRSFSVLFGLPKVAWMNMLRLAAAKGVAFIPHMRIACLERATAGPSTNADGLVAVPIDRFTDAHATLWRQAREALAIKCAIHRDLETLGFRNGGHRNFEIRSATGLLTGYASVRKDGLLFDIVAVEQALYDPTLGAVLNTLRGSEIEALKVMEAPYYGDLQALGFVKSEYQFGFVSEALDPDLTDLTAPGNWYLAGGG